MMKRRIAALILALLLCALTVCPAFAARERAPRLNDAAGLFSPLEKAKLLARLNEVSERREFDLVVLTAPASEVGDDLQQFSETYYREHGYGFGEEDDGMVLLLSLDGDGRLTYAYTLFGEERRGFDEAAMDAIEAAIRAPLEQGAYLEACTAFADTLNGVLTEKDGIGIGFWLVLSLLFGALISFLGPMAAYRRQLKTVEMQSSAAGYIRNLQLTRRQDLFLYRNLTRTPLPKHTDARK